MQVWEEAINTHCLNKIAPKSTLSGHTPLHSTVMAKQGGRSNNSRTPVASFQGSCVMCAWVRVQREVALRTLEIVGLTAGKDIQGPSHFARTRSLGRLFCSTVPIWILKGAFLFSCAPKHWHIDLHLIFLQCLNHLSYLDGKTCSQQI